MSMTFTKLFSSITESTVWLEPSDIRIVWIAMLAMADKHGRVWGSIPGLANRARVPVESARNAIAAFLAPDPDSRTKDHEGRRIREIDGGWALLNYGKYRTIRDEAERLSYKAQKERERRARIRGQKSGQTDATPSTMESTQPKPKRGQKRGQNGQACTGVDSRGHNADAEADAEAEVKVLAPVTQGKEGGLNAMQSTVEASASCEPLPASLPSTQTSVDPEHNAELREAANLAVLATPFFQAKPAVQATAVTVTHRREVYRAADWEVANDPTRKLSFADALASLRKLFEKHQRGSPDEFHSYDAKPLKFYLADKAFHNRPKKPFAVVKPTRFLNDIRRDELAGRKVQ